MTIPKITRRALLAGIAATSTVALPAVAIAAPGPASELADMVERFRDVRHRACDATTAREECEIATRKTFPKRPASLMGTPYWCTDRSACYSLTAEDINRYHDDPAMVLNLGGDEIAKLEKKRLALLRKLAKWEAREQAMPESADWRALKVAEDALDAEADDLEEKILAYQARTMADVAAKVRFLGSWEPFIEIENQPEATGIVELAYVSLLADVQRLAGKGGAA